MCDLPQRAQAWEMVDQDDRAWVVLWTIEKNGKTKQYYFNEYLDGTKDMYWALKAPTLDLACSWVEEAHQRDLDNGEPRLSSLTIKEVSLNLAGRNCLKQPE